MATAAASGPQSRTAQTVLPMLSTLSGMGVDVHRLLETAGLSAPELAQPDSSISVEQGAKLVELALDATGDPALALHIVERVDPGPYNLFTYLAATSATPREAHARAARYLRLAGDDFEVKLEVQGGRTVCSISTSTSSSRGAGRAARFAAEMSVGLMVKLGRMVTGSLEAVEAWFAHDAPDYAPEYERVLQLPVRFAASCDAIVGGAETLDAPLPNADSALCELLDRHAQQLLERLPQTDSLADRVRQRIAGELPSGNPSAEHVAESLHMSARTLRRRLHEEGSSHQQLLDEVRSELARSYLAEGKLAITEVAFLLGFSDASAFHKAFRRWSGSRPGARRTS